MIITFPRLQRISQLERPSAIKRWLQKRQVAYLTDADGQPFTTLDAINRRLQHARDREGVPDYGAAYRLRAERERETAERRAAARLVKETAKQQRKDRALGLPGS